MSLSKLHGTWHVVKGRLAEVWGMMMGFRGNVLAGKQEQMIGMLQKHYGLSEMEARSEYQKLKNECHCT